MESSIARIYLFIIIIILTLAAREGSTLFYALLTLTSNDNRTQNMSNQRIVYCKCTMCVKEDSIGQRQQRIVSKRRNKNRGLAGPDTGAKKVRFAVSNRDDDDGYAFTFGDTDGGKHFYKIFSADFRRIQQVLSPPSQRATTNPYHWKIFRLTNRRSKNYRSTNYQLTNHHLALSQRMTTTLQMTPQSRIPLKTCPNFHLLSMSPRLYDLSRSKVCRISRSLINGLHAFLLLRHHRPSRRCERI